MIELVIAMAVSAYVVRHSTELVSAITGKQTDWQKAQANRITARTAAREAKAASAGRKSPRKRGAFWDYLALLWEDGWTDAKSKHSVRRSRRLARQAEKPSSSGSMRGFGRQVKRDGWNWWDRKWDEATERRAAKTRPYEPSPSSPVVPGITVPVPDDLSDRQFVRPDEDGTKPQSEPQTAQPGPKEPEPATTPSADQSTAEPTRSATIATPTPEGTTMSTPNTEVTGLDSSVQFCQDGQNNASIVSLGLEQLAAFLEASKVEGAVFGHLAAAKEHYDAARASLQSAESELTRGYGVREAYEAAQGAAGDKQFVEAQ